MNVFYVISGLIVLGLVHLSRAGASETGVVRMNLYSWIQLIFYLVVLLALAKPLGSFMARVFQGERTFLDPILGPLERLIYRLSGVKPDEDMNWKTYAIAMMLFNVLGCWWCMPCSGCRRCLPLNPAGTGRGDAGFLVEHRGQLCHQHQLAGVWRRGDHELPLADAGPDRAELRFGGDRHGGPGRPDSRHCAAHDAGHRQLLGRPDADHALHSSAACVGRGAGDWSHKAWCRPSAPTRPLRCLQPTTDANGDRGDGAGAGRWVRRHHRLRSSNWARTAEDSSTSTRRTPSRTRRRSRISWRCYPSS